MRDAVTRAVDAVADGVVVDWPVLLGDARSETERTEIEWLKIVGDVAGVHRSEAAFTEGETTRAVLDARRPAAALDEWGHYRLVRRLGAGSFGSVYCAWDPELERHIAIKILHEPVADQMVRRRLLQEGRALARVTHENVVRVLGIEAHGDRVGLCMELVSGDTLEHVLQTRGLLSAREAALVGEDVCRALAAVHRAGYLHRDVKARNVMRDQTGRIVLMDFGTGFDLAGERRPSGVEGTPVYMAPEVLTGEPASIQSDVYSIGVLLYHLVTGLYPVEGGSLLDLIDAHGHGRRRPLSERRPDLPVPFVHVVSRALAERPEDRWPGAGAMLEALGRLRGEPGPQESTGLGTAVRVLGAMAGGAAGLLALGILNSRYFNVTLGREGFAFEGVRDWFYWGASSIVAPGVLVMMVLVGFGVLRAAVRLLLPLMAAGRRLDAEWAGWVRRVGLDEVPNAAAFALVVSVLALVVGGWSVSDQLTRLTSLVFPTISGAPVQDLAFLSPERQNLHNAYRATFVWVAIICVALWSVPFRLASRRHQHVSPAMSVAAVATLVLVIGLLDFPYRLLYQADFEAVRWQGRHCYVLGESESDYLLFCPELEPPRNRTVGKDAALEHLAAKENIFGHASLRKAGSP